MDMDKWGDIILNKWGRRDKIHQPRCGPLGLPINVEKGISTFLLVSFSCGLWLNLGRLSFFICKSVFSGPTVSRLASPRPPKSEASLPPFPLSSHPSPSSSSSSMPHLPPLAFASEKGPEKDLCFGAGPIAPNLHLRAGKGAAEQWAPLFPAPLPLRSLCVVVGGDSMYPRIA